MQLSLKKPIVFFDLETTGLNILSDRIMQIAMLKVHPNGTEEEFMTLVNPECPIPAFCSELTGITDEMVKEAPTFKQVARKVTDFMRGCDLGGFNSNKFDIPLLMEEVLRAGIKDFDLKGRRLIDVMNIYHKKERRNLSAAYLFYCGKDLESAHSADADTRATYEVLKGQLDKYPDLENDMDFLHEYSQKERFADIVGNIILNEKDEPVFNFGKYKNRPVEEVFAKEPSYYNWIMDGQFAQSTKRFVTEIKMKMLMAKK